jgi:hypothetical protein
MRLFPSISFDLMLPDPPAGVAARVTAWTKPDNWFLRFFWGSPISSSERFPFIGDVSDSGFRVRRNISYGNSFRPELCGQFIQTDGGTQVHVTMAIRRRDARALTVAMAIIAAISLVGVIGMLLSRQWDWFWVLGFCGMLLFWWGLIQACFWIDAPTSRKLITRILSGTYT